MADVSGVAGPQAGVEFTVPSATTNRYILGDGEVGFASQIVLEVLLNGATVTYDFQARVAGGTTAAGWVAQLGYPFNSATGVTTNTTTMGYQIDASGKTIALNISANNGTPIILWRPVVG